MAQRIINNGESGLDVRGKLNDNFAELFTLATTDPYPKVLNHAALPTATGSGDIYLVRNTSGIIGFRKLAGLWQDNAVDTWDYLGLYGRSANEIANVPGVGSSASNVQDALDDIGARIAAGAVDSRSFRFSTDFPTANAIQHDFVMALIGTGAAFTTIAVAGALSPHHPGVVQWRSGTTANSGVQCMTLGTAFRLGGGERWDVNLFTGPVLTTILLRTGALDTVNATAPVDGVFFEMNGSGNIIGVCRSNNVQSVTPTLATVSPSTWWHGRITLNADATVATFEVFGDNPATLLGSATLATNIPVAAGREVGWGTVMTSSGTVAIELGHIDRQVATCPGRVLLRGAA